MRIDLEDLTDEHPMAMVVCTSWGGDDGIPTSGVVGTECDVSKLYTLLIELPSLLGAYGGTGTSSFSGR